MLVHASKLWRSQPRSRTCLAADRSALRSESSAAFRAAASA